MSDIDDRPERDFANDEDRAFIEAEYREARLAEIDAILEYRGQPKRATVEEESHE